MPERVARLLAACGVELSAQELLDALWLAGRMPAGAAAPLAQGLSATGAAAAPAAAPAAPPAPAPRPDRAVVGAGPGTPPAAAGESGGGPAARRAPRVVRGALHAAPASRSGWQTRHPAGTAAQPVRVPGEKALAAELRLYRVLRPLKQRLPSARAVELDEEATVTAMAETGLPDVAVRPAGERWLDLALVVDDGTSMLLWRRLCAELRTLLERLGAFRTVTVYGLHSRGAGPPRLRRRAFDTGRAQVSPAALADPTGRTLVLVVSDGLGAMWRDGRMHAVLERWARCGPSAVVHALPRRLWGGSSIRAQPWLVTTRQRGSPNAAWRVADPVLPPELAPFDGVPVPVLTPEPAAVGAWAGLLASSGGTVRLPLLEPASPAVPPEPAQPPAGPGTADPVLAFRDAATPEAYRLAAHLAAVAPVSVPVMRLVQHAVPWQAETAHLAEVFLGGLMRQADSPARGASLPAQHLSFDFTEAARAILLDAVPPAELLQTSRRVAERLARLAGHSPDFPAWLAHPRGQAELPPGGAPFAWLSSRLLAHIGMSGAPAAPPAPRKAPGPDVAPQPVSKAGRAAGHQPPDSAGGQRSEPDQDRAAERLRKIARLRARTGRGHHIVVIGSDAGAGRTTTAVLLGATLAGGHPTRVIAVDADPHTAGLSRALPLSTTHALRDLAKAAPRLSSHAGIRPYVSVVPTGLTALGNDAAAARRGKFTPLRRRDYRRAVELLGSHYPVIVTDTASSLIAENPHAILELADQVVIVCSYDASGAKSASRTLEWLTHNGYPALARHAFLASRARRRAVGRASRPRFDITGLMRKCSGVVVLPHDPLLARGGNVRLEELGSRTRAAFLDLAVLIAEDAPRSG